MVVTVASLPLVVTGDPWLYTVARCVLVPLARLYGRFEVQGVERVPRSGPVLVVADHPSDLDPLLVALPVRRTLHFLASDDHYRRRFVGWCMRRLATVPVDPDGMAPDALSAALGLLAAGEAVAVFREPHGPHAADPLDLGDDPLDLRAAPPLGVGLACLVRSGVPLVAVSVVGAAELQRGRWRHELPGGWLRRPRVVVVFREAAARPASSPGGSRNGSLPARVGKPSVSE